MSTDKAMKEVAKIYDALSNLERKAYCLKPDESQLLRDTQRRLEGLIEQNDYKICTTPNGKRYTAKHKSRVNR